MVFFFGAVESVLLFVMTSQMRVQANRNMLVKNPPCDKKYYYILYCHPVILNKTDSVRTNVILRHVRVTIFAVEEQ
jgi:hypothetical protein